MTRIAPEDESLHQLQRSMGEREIAGGRARTAVLRRRYQAAPEDVWHAITTPERIDRFFLPVRGDLRVGGHFSVEGQASGRILACEPPTLLRLEWVPPGGGEHVDQVEVRLIADGQDATWLELEHASTADIFNFDLGSGCYSPAIGWEGPLHYLGEHLRGTVPDAPGAEWYVYDEAEEVRLGQLRAIEWSKAESNSALRP